MHKTCFIALWICFLGICCLMQLTQVIMYWLILVDFQCVKSDSEVHRSHAELRASHSISVHHYNLHCIRLTTKQNASQTFKFNINMYLCKLKSTIQIMLGNCMMNSWSFLNVWCAKSSPDFLKVENLVHGKRFWWGIQWTQRDISGQPITNKRYVRPLLHAEDLNIRNTRVVV
jgi:hypothetical protein